MTRAFVAAHLWFEDRHRSLGPYHLHVEDLLALISLTALSAAAAPPDSDEAQISIKTHISAEDTAPASLVRHPELSDAHGAIHHHP